MYGLLFDPSAHTYGLEISNAHPDSDVTYGVSNISMASDDSVRFSLTAGDGQQIDNHGGATTYDLSVRISGASTEAVFSHLGVVLAANCAHRIISNWRQSGGNLVILIDPGMTGTFTDTAHVGNQSQFCICSCHADPHCDAQMDILDVIDDINVAFRAQPEQLGLNCPTSRENVDCVGAVDILDVVHMVNAAFRGGNQATEFCKTCP